MRKSLLSLTSLEPSLSPPVPVMLAGGGRAPRSPQRPRCAECIYVHPMSILSPYPRPVMQRKSKPMIKPMARGPPAQVIAESYQS
jgi:hypothetical protein